MRARDAASCSRASALASACATSSVKPAMRSSAAGGKACVRTLETTTAPHSWPSNTIGAPTPEAMPSSCRRLASDPVTTA